MSAFEGLKAEWRATRSAAPGTRFEGHYERTRAHSSRASIAARAVIGVIAVIAGIVMLAIPGPGLLFVAGGLALIATASKTMAKWLDRAEPPVRRTLRRLKSWWARVPLIAKLAIGAVVLVVVAGLAYLAWRVLFSGG